MSKTIKDFSQEDQDFINNYAKEKVELRMKRENDKQDSSNQKITELENKIKSIEEKSNQTIKEALKSKYGADVDKAINYKNKGLEDAEIDKLLGKETKIPSIDDINKNDEVDKTTKEDKVVQNEKEKEKEDDEFNEDEMDKELSKFKS